MNAIPIECNSNPIQPRERRYVERHGFLSFARNLGTHSIKVTKNLNNNYGQKLADSAKKSALGAFKIASKKAIQKTAEATGDLIGNKIADKITSYSKNQQMNHTQIMLAMKHQKKDIYLHKKENIIRSI